MYIVSKADGMVIAGSLWDYYIIPKTMDQLYGKYCVSLQMCIVASRTINHSQSHGWNCNHAHLGMIPLQDITNNMREVLIKFIQIISPFRNVLHIYT